MSYSFGQFRCTQLNSYATPLSMEIDRQQKTEEGTTFYDTCGNLSGLNIVNAQNCYYLQFGIRQRRDSEQIFYLKLRNRSKTEDNEQLIEEYKVTSGTGVVYFQVILSPNDTYDQILWELQRDAIDYVTTNADETTGRIIEIVSYTYTKLINILIPLKSMGYPNIESLIKIGIQGPPSLLMCINREQIRIGRTGIYEINNGIKITSISFVPKESASSDYFLMDFEY